MGARARGEGGGETGIAGRQCTHRDLLEVLTALGWQLAALPVEPRIGKLLVYGALLGCLDPVLTIAAALAHRSPFVMPLLF